MAFSGAAFATFAVVVNLVPLLAERGVGPGTAAIALGLGGAGQVAGRLSYATLTRAGVRTRTALILLAMATTTALLGVLTCAPALIAAAMLLSLASTPTLAPKEHS